MSFNNYFDSVEKEKFVVEPKEKEKKD